MQVECIWFNLLYCRKTRRKEIRMSIYSVYPTNREHQMILSLRTTASASLSTPLTLLKMC